MTRAAAQRLGRAPRAQGGAAAPAAAPPPTLSELRHGLQAPRERPYRPPAWLADSARDPAAWWRAVAPALLGAAGGSARSSLFERYNLFHELVARHAERGRIAIAEHDPPEGFAETSYAALAERAACLARAWKNAGVAPGQTVAVVAGPGADGVVALAAAWRAGAVPAPIPALGRSYMRARLDALAADFVATSEGRAAWLRVPAAQALPLRPPDDVLPDRDPPHGWAADEPALRCFSPLGHEALVVHEVAAQALLLGALRDGHLLLALEPGQTLAAPGFCPVQERLPLLLAALAAGASFVDMTLEAAIGEPDLLLGRAPVLGVRDELRDALLAAPPRRRLERWFRNPADEPAYARWERFAAAPVAERALGMNLYTSAAAGGAIACSAWRPNPGRNQVLLAPGHAWRLASASLRSADALGDSGVLAAGEDALPASAIGRPVLARAGGEHLWVTSLDTHRRGQRLPAQEICAAVLAAHPAVQRAALVDYPRGDGGLASGAALVLFVRPGAEDPRAAEVADTIAVELGEQFLPDRTDCFHVPARTDDEGALDADWCRAQYVGGLLALKEREPLFHALGRLHFAREQEAPGEAPGQASGRASGNASGRASDKEG